MSRLETPFRYDHVGSFLRPEKLKEARRKFDDGAIGYDELKKVEDEYWKNPNDYLLEPEDTFFE